MVCGEGLENIIDNEIDRLLVNVQCHKFSKKITKIINKQKAEAAEMKIRETGKKKTATDK